LDHAQFCIGQAHAKLNKFLKFKNNHDKKNINKIKLNLKIIKFRNIIQNNNIIITLVKYKSNNKYIYIYIYIYIYKRL